MGEPTVDPLERADVPSADSYRRGDLIWVHRDGQWLPGEVEGSGWAGVQVRYEVGGGGRVDTVTADYVMRRDVP